MNGMSSMRKERSKARPRAVRTTSPQRVGLNARPQGTLEGLSLGCFIYDGDGQTWQKLLAHQKLEYCSKRDRKFRPESIHV